MHLWIPTSRRARARSTYRRPRSGCGKLNRASSPIPGSSGCGAGQEHDRHRWDLVEHPRALARLHGVHIHDIRLPLANDDTPGRWYRNPRDNAKRNRQEFDSGPDRRSRSPIIRCFSPSAQAREANVYRMWCIACGAVPVCRARQLTGTSGRTQSQFEPFSGSSSV